MTMLLDPALGPVSDQVRDAITGICGDALHAVLGPGLAQAVMAETELLSRIAPWAGDLARGLQYGDRYGAGDPSTSLLVIRLARRPLPSGLVTRLAKTVDLTVSLTLGRVTDQVLGPRSSLRDPVADQLIAPWLPALKLGYRIGLVLEILRLSDPAS